MSGFLMIFGLVLGVAINSHADEIIFTISPGKHQNVTFHSKASIESFDGTTDRISGSIAVDPENLESASASFTVDMQTLDTGIKLRNRHMMENHLHTNQYPEATFSLKMIKPPVKLINQQAVSFSGFGAFFLHGVTKEIDVPVNVTWYQDGTQTPLKTSASALHITGEFPVALADYNITRPQFLVLKLAKTQQVTIDLWAVAGE